MYIKLSIFIAAIFIVIDFPFLIYATQTDGIISIILTIISNIIFILMLINNFRIMIYRLHDMNVKGTWVLLSLIPFVYLIFPIVLMFIPGTKGENRFGEETNDVSFNDFVHIIIGIFILFYAAFGYLNYVKSDQYIDFFEDNEKHILHNKKGEKQYDT